jgi:hypothetical protein
MHREVVAAAMKIVWATYSDYRLSKNCDKFQLATSYLSACPHGTTLIPFDGVS